MRLSDFDFELPPEQIAQTPALRRDGSRLMVLDRALGVVKTGHFQGILDYFRPGDVLVLNDTRVIPARLLGRKESGGKIEVLLVRRLSGDEEVWACLTKSSKSPRPGSRLLMGEGITGTVLAGGEEPYRQIRFAVEGDFLQAIEKVGHIPLPPYIHRDDDRLDRERYQTVYARTAGSVAAPTAGLHFTEDLLDTLRERGVTICPVTLHVGLGTFLPVRSEDILSHRMHEENYFVPEATAALVNEARARGDRIFALGTTSTRTLEYAADDKGRLVAGEGVCDLFITPGYRFRIVDALVTNFHLPRSTLLMLVSAFAGRDFVLKAYRQAVAEGFRFFSYGDCMLII
ncbi:MAG: tRNA preQ1(34) S-adenosylmethionine ribosyltransferase-isomerase QueA [Syntrophotaleaceae bacterium]